MAQHKQLTWTELRVGLFTLAAAILLVIVIFYVTGSTGVWGAKYRLRTYLSEVDGLTIGAPVRLDGFDVGNVDAIRIAEREPGAPVDQTHNIEVVLRIQRAYQEYIRTDSTAGLITEGLLGNRYVDIDRGTKGAALKDGEVSQGREEQDLKQVVARSADLMQDLDALSKQASGLLSNINAGHGTLGKLITNDEAYNHINSMLGRLDSLVAKMEAGNGTLGKLITSDEAYNHFNSAAARLDDLLDAVQSQKGTLGKFVYDPAIANGAKSFIDNGNAVFTDIRAGKGTLGKLVTDDSLYTKYRQVGDNLAEATAKLNSNQTTAGKFFSDPQFYDNITGLTGDMRLLIGDFHNNPKKYLHVKFSIF